MPCSMSEAASRESSYRHTGHRGTRRTPM
jgi:hypothetical protein